MMSLSNCFHTHHDIVNAFMQIWTFEFHERFKRSHVMKSTNNHLNQSLFVTHIPLCPVTYILICPVVNNIWLSWTKPSSFHTTYTTWKPTIIFALDRLTLNPILISVIFTATSSDKVELLFDTRCSFENRWRGMKHILLYHKSLLVNQLRLSPSLYHLHQLPSKLPIAL